MTKQILSAAGALQETLTPEQYKILSGRTPVDIISHREGPGGLTLPYIPHGYVRAVLNKVFGWNWDFRLLPVGEDGKTFIVDESEGRKNSVVVLGRLTVRVADPNDPTETLAEIVKEDFGGAELKRKITFDNLIKTASSDALKRCAVSLGIGLDLYLKDPSDKYIPVSEQQEQLLALTDQYVELLVAGKSPGEIKQELGLDAAQFQLVRQQAKLNRAGGNG